MSTLIAHSDHNKDMIVVSLQPEVDNVQAVARDEQRDQQTRRRIQAGNLADTWIGFLLRRDCPSNHGSVRRSSSGWTVQK